MVNCKSKISGATCSDDVVILDIPFDTIDFLLNREEAHNTMFREAFNRIQDTGSLKDWGITKDYNSSYHSLPI
jgi:Mn-containing catalase